MIKLPDKYVFSVNFFELSKLTEICWSGLTVADVTFLNSMIDIHFHLMDFSQRKLIYKQFSEKLKSDKDYYPKESEGVREMLVSRYNPMNYLIVNELFDTPMFYFKQKYWIDHSTTYDTDKIITCEYITE